MMIDECIMNLNGIYFDYNGVKFITYNYTPSVNNQSIKYIVIEVLNQISYSDFINT